MDAQPYKGAKAASPGYWVPGSWEQAGGSVGRRSAAVTARMSDGPGLTMPNSMRAGG